MKQSIKNQKHVAHYEFAAIVAGLGLLSVVTVAQDKARDDRRREAPRGM